MVLPPPQHNMSLDWYSITDSRTILNSKKKMKWGVTPKTPKQLFPAGCCHSSPLGTLDSRIGVRS